MATAIFFTTSKRKNSTLIPTSGSAIELELKGGADILSPTFSINYAVDEIPPFSMILYQGRYYFIDSIRSVRKDLWELSCSVDVLATYKANILASNAFVLYSNHTNTELTDSRIPTKTSATYSEKTASFDTLGSGGYTIVINVTGTNACASYAISETRANELLNAYISWFNSGDSYVPDYSGSVFEDVEEALKALIDMVRGTARQLIGTGSAADGIKSAYAIPIPLSSFGGTASDIYLGNYNTGKDGQKITDRVFSDGCEIEIPWQASDWRRNAPYHEIYLYIPYIGMVSISPSDVMDYESLHVSCNIDKCNGDSIFYVWVGDSAHVIGQYSTNIGSTYAIGSSNVTPIQSATSLGGAAGGAAALIGGVTGGAAVAAVGAVGLGIVNAINGSPTSISSNAGGAVLGMTGRCACYTVFHDTIVTPSNIAELQGTPTSKSMSLAELTGYVQTQSFSISGNMTGIERDEINSMMDGGVYIE